MNSFFTIVTIRWITQFFENLGDLVAAPAQLADGLRDGDRDGRATAARAPHVAGRPSVPGDAEDGACDFMICRHLDVERP